MQAEDRLIHFSTELVHRPHKHDVPALQKLYFDLSQARPYAYDSTDFSQPGQPPRFYSRRGERTQSLAVFLPDRLLLAEEWVDTALVDFCDKVQEVAGRVFKSLPLGNVMVQAVTLRSTFALIHFEDARVFLMDHVCNQANQIGPHFRRPIATGGLRFVLPETPDHPGNLHVTIESFRHNPKEVFVELKGVYPKQNLAPDDLGALRGNIMATRRFITNSIFPYLNQYDVPQEDTR